jgi:hypothetical protein
MATAAGPHQLQPASTGAFERLAAGCALAAAVAGLGYAVSFVILDSDPASALFLLLGGLLAVPVLVALYGRVQATEPALALCALLIGVAGALGTVAHGGYDLANALHPPGSGSDLPNAVDPRGLAAFGLTGVSLAMVAWLIRRGDRLPHALGALGYLLAALLVLLYVGRLVILDAKSPAVAIPALLVGFVVNPAWYLWLARVLRARA